MDVFGPVADLYETARPGYPAEIADAIVAYHGGTPAPVVEIGAGPGKATRNTRARRALAPGGTLAIFGHRYPSRPPDQQQRGLTALSRLVDDFGGTVVLDLRTTLVLASAEGQR